MDTKNINKNKVYLIEISLTIKKINMEYYYSVYPNNDFFINNIKIFAYDKIEIIKPPK